MPFYSKRNEPAFPKIEAIENESVGYNTNGFQGLSKREEAALRIYTQFITITPTSVNGWKAAASDAITAADIFFDELERPEREQQEAWDAEHKKKSDRYLELKDKKDRTQQEVDELEDLIDYLNS